MIEEERIEKEAFFCWFVASIFLIALLWMLYRRIRARSLLADRSASFRVEINAFIVRLCLASVWFIEIQEYPITQLNKHLLVLAH
jgi:hypothetical protein